MLRTHRAVAFELENRFHYTSPVHPSRSGSEGPTTLASLANGERAAIVSVECARPVAVRLLEMGLVPGTEIEVRRRAPLGDPIELSVRGFSLTVRKSDALSVSVERRGSGAKR
jgi:ferrous iron transport protein A